MRRPSVRNIRLEVQPLTRLTPNNSMEGRNKLVACRVQYVSVLYFLPQLKRVLFVPRAYA